MKKIFVALCLFVAVLNAMPPFNCCAMTIMNSFVMTTGGDLDKLLKEQLKSLQNLEKAINQQNKTLNKQDTQLNQKLNLLKEENIRNRELLFYLKQKNNMQ